MKHGLLQKNEYQAISKSFYSFLEAKKLSHIINLVDAIGINYFSHKQRIIYYDAHARILEQQRLYQEATKYRKLALEYLESLKPEPKIKIARLEEKISLNWDFSRVFNIDPSNFLLRINIVIDSTNEIIKYLKDARKNYYEKLLLYAIKLKVIKLIQFANKEREAEVKKIYTNKAIHEINRFNSLKINKEDGRSWQMELDLLLLKLFFYNLDDRNYQEKDIKKITDFAKHVLKKSSCLNIKESNENKIIFYLISCINNIFDSKLRSKNSENLIFQLYQYKKIEPAIFNFKKTKKLFSLVMSNNSMIAYNHGREFKYIAPYLKQGISLIRKEIIGEFTHDILMKEIIEADNEKVNKYKLLSNIKKGEGQKIEFKSGFIDKQIAKVIASFANTNDGILYIGINDKGEITGLEEPDTIKNRDKLQHKLFEITSSKITPPVIPQVIFDNIDGKLIMEVRVFYNKLYKHRVDGKVLVRHLESKRIATDDEVELLK